MGMREQKCTQEGKGVSIIKAPWETFPEFATREASEAPYDDAFIRKCREKALEYDAVCFHGQPDKSLRAGLLQELYRCVPVHRRGNVFAGIANFQPTWWRE